MYNPNVRTSLVSFLIQVAKDPMLGRMMTDPKFASVLAEFQENPQATLTKARLISAPLVLVPKWASDVQDSFRSSWDFSMRACRCIAIPWHIDLIEEKELSCHG